ncbi:hypothetical protein [Paenibacillus sp. GCM10012303]|uniref:hypothetical protein n=1 Tax=Paenibacillus sp. GCM10012303 TaxID=3317340 RepID=UPI003620EA59
MRIFTRKSLQFDHPAGQEPAVVVSAGQFAVVPAWVEKSRMYQLASRDGSVELIESRRDEIEAEEGADGKSDKADKAAAAKAKKEAEAKAKAEAAEEAARLKAEEEARKMAADPE